MQRIRVTRSRAPLALVAGVSALGLLLSACGGSSDDAPVASGSPGAGGSSVAASGDTGAKLTMWVRDATGAYSKALVDDYNSTHKNRVTLTVVPNDTYQQKIGQAAGSKALPDLLGADVVYSPNYVSQGLFADLTDRLKALPFYDSLAKAHTQAATLDGKIFAVPHKVDSSVILYNKDLFKKAGLDPENPPRSYDDIYAAAKKIRALGSDIYGFYVAGNCGGCNAYTAMPYGVADGHPPVKDGGKSSDITGDSMTKAFANYKRMFDEDIIPASAKTENGATWDASFVAGKVGMLPAGSFVFADVLAKSSFDWGVIPLGNADGSKSATFVGGDVLAIAAPSKNQDAAWNFTAWTLDQHAQVDIIAKGGDLTARSDLADNKYSSAHPQVVETIRGLANGWTPSAVNYGPAFNDTNGPWSAAVRGAMLTSDGQKALVEGQSKIDGVLKSG